MKVKEFVEKIKVANVENIFESIRRTSYLPVSKKKELVALVLELSMTNNEGFVQIDEFKKYINLKRLFVQEYFNLEFSRHEFLEEYDMLESMGILDYILEDYLGAEYKRIIAILEQETKNILSKHSIEAELVGLIQQARAKVESLSEIFNGQLKDFDLTQILPEGMTTADFINMVERLK
jgi:hypothetical protein